MNSSLSKHKNNLELANEDIAQSLLDADKDLYRLCLYEKNANRKNLLITFFALLTELEKIPFIASEPAISAIRLKWWYDSINDHSSSDNSPPLLIAIQKLISQNKLDKESILALINVLQDEKVITQSDQHARITSYCKNKAELVTNCLKLDKKHLLTISYLLFIRLAKKNKALKLDDEVEPSTDKTGLFIYKTNIYCKIMNKKMSDGEPLELSTIDKIKLHFK